MELRPVPEGLTITGGLSLGPNPYQGIDITLGRSHSACGRFTVNELKAEANPKWVKWRRLEYLIDRIVEIKIEACNYETKREKNKVDNPKYNLERSLINRRLLELYDRQSTLDSQIRAVMYDDPYFITVDQIAAAREFPFERLVEVRRGTALCPFHDDNHPSMGIKYNRFNCFACGVKGDTIEFVMRRDGLNFVEAIKFLT